MDELGSILDVLNNDMMKETLAKEPTYNTNDPGLIVKVQKLHENAVIPSYSKLGDAGMDLTAVDVQETEDYVSYRTGLAMEIPKGYVGLLFPRSSNCKKDLLLTNSVGVIDSGYRGEILPYPQIYMTQVPELSSSERGDGGFGSTGK